ncbi:MAG: ATP-binding cassette domain-containing protein [Candidatus Krumholzibacteriota bacterium]|nr:ATP-binding cassette domain-containing protein [Candidatus Krumholzibacteriota bacterium]
MISLRDVSVVYDGKHRAIENLTLDIGAGEWLALLGGNGSGKTTLLKLLAGVIPAASGVVEFRGSSRPRTAFLFQEPDNQFVSTSVRSELKLSVPESGPNRESGIETAVDRFDLARVLSRNPHRLSGGEKQRLALATVWLQDPELLLLDEPTSYLDTQMTAACLSFIHEMHDRGTTIVWATPGGEELMHSEETVCLRERSVVFRGTIDELYEWADATAYSFKRPPVRSLAEEFVSLGVARASGRETIDVAGTSVDALAQWIAGEVESVGDVQRTTHERSGGDRSISFENVAFAWGETRVFDSLSFEARTGEVVGIGGANAAGKSTLLLLAGGVHKPSSGRVRHTAKRPFYLPQTPEDLFFAETVREELAFGVRHSDLSPRDREQRMVNALMSVGLDPAGILERFPFHLSLGEMRRVAFAIARVVEPDLLLLDEPNSCLDAEGTEALRQLVRGECERGTTVLIASHDTALLCDVCHRVVIVGDGRAGAEIDVRDGVVPVESVWPPGSAPLVVDLQNALSARGVRVWPHAATPQALAARVSAAGPK